MDMMIFLNTTNPAMAGDSVTIICSIRVNKIFLDKEVNVDLHLVSLQGMNATRK